MASKPNEDDFDFEIEGEVTPVPDEGDKPEIDIEDDTPE